MRPMSRQMIGIINPENLKICITETNLAPNEKEHCIIVSIERASRSDVRGDHFVKLSSLILLRT